MVIQTTEWSFELFKIKVAPLGDGGRRARSVAGSI
jgi:hypothetical protein